MERDDLKKYLDKFKTSNGKNGGMDSKERYSSFDYCFNYFQSFKNKKDIANNKNIEKSSLHLGFYLSSWGMLRGSSFLLEKSIGYLKEIIIFISKYDKKIWNIDLDYSENDIDILLKFKNDLIKTFVTNKNKFSDTLITKIMLGIFGNIPAYDNNFKIFLKNNNFNQTFNKTSLKEINNFYKKHNEMIYKEARNIKTFDFKSGYKSNISYTRAKIIDMIGFSFGQENLKINTKNS